MIKHVFPGWRIDLSEAPSGHGEIAVIEKVVGQMSEPVWSSDVLAERVDSEAYALESLTLILRVYLNWASSGVNPFPVCDQMRVGTPVTTPLGPANVTACTDTHIFVQTQMANRGRFYLSGRIGEPLSLGVSG